ncbi:MAG: hypothetical protein AAF317_16820 [Pseudomonadota bacterium]
MSGGSARAQSGRTAALGQLDGSGAEPVGPGNHPPRPLPQQSGAFSIVSATKVAAADGTTANSRTTIGVGEKVEVGTSDGRPATWTIPGRGGTGGRRARTEVTWPKSGSQTIEAKRGSQTATLGFTIIDPKPKPEKIKGLTIAEMKKMARDAGRSFPAGAGARGVYMQLKFVLEPASVAFSRLKFLELPDPNTTRSGYFKDHPKLADDHQPSTTPVGVRVDAKRNVIGRTDLAGFHLDPADPAFALPVTNGEFGWSIPLQYAVGVDAADRGDA